jgi:hypothetical protein
MTMMSLAFMVRRSPFQVGTMETRHALEFNIDIVSIEDLD